LKNNRFRFVHFATHGLVNDDRPDYSGLALAGSGTDALLQASEIFNLPINADMVVLSACETGLGQLVKGEGMVGLTRAFMYAGASTVAVSLWSVSDQSTSTLMREFYGHLRGADASKTEALQRAKLTLLSDESTAHPFHWAPFILVGLND
ncbi:MAG: CHAT domain-containing protein, partial [Rhodothermales bacterium]|nr:CHAT domain-containing protein [Rhodothermales bacterium]